MGIQAFEYLKEERFDKKIYIKSKNGSYLSIYKDKTKSPTLECINEENLSEEEILEEKIEAILLLIKALSYEIFKNDFVKKEALKIIYEYIKIEICYNEEGKSKILEKVKEKNLDITKLVQKDIEEMACSAYIDPSLYEYFKNVQKLYKNTYDENIIKAIIMCTNYGLIKKGNKHILDNKYQTLKQTRYYRLTYDTKIEIEKTQKELKAKRKDLLKVVILAIGTIATVVTSNLIYNHFNNHFQNEVPKETQYQTITETYTSLDTYEKEEGLSEYLIDPSRILLTRYEKAYESDGELLRKVSMYYVTNFETTKDLKKYYEIDFDNTLFQPFSHKIIKVEEDAPLEEYIEIERMTQDEENKIEKPNKTISFATNGALAIICVGILGLSLIYEGKKIIEYYEYFDTSKIIYKDQEEKLKKLIKRCQKILEKNGYTLQSAMKRCDEIIGTSSYKELTEEYKETIEMYQKIKKEHEELEKTIETQRKALKL